jgi:hypothetical protein
MTKTRKRETTMTKMRYNFAFSSSYLRVFVIVLSRFCVFVIVLSRFRVFVIVLSHLRHRTFAFSSSWFRVFVIVLSHLRHRAFASSSSYFRLPVRMRIIKGQSSLHYFQKPNVSILTLNFAMVYIKQVMGPTGNQSNYIHILMHTL